MAWPIVTSLAVYVHMELRGKIIKTGGMAYLERGRAGGRLPN